MKSLTGFTPAELARGIHVKFNQVHDQRGRFATSRGGMRDRAWKATSNIQPWSSDSQKLNEARRTFVYDEIAEYVKTRPRSETEEFYDDEELSQKIYEKYTEAANQIVYSTNWEHSQKLRQAATELLGRDVKDEHFGPTGSLFSQYGADPDLKVALEADHQFNAAYVKRHYGEWSPSGKIDLARGLGPGLLKKYPDLKEGDEVEVSVNSLSSWTIHKQVAEDFARNRQGTRIAEKPEDRKGVVVTAKFDPKDVFMTSDTHDERESQFAGRYRERSKGDHTGIERGAGVEFVIGSASPIIKVRVSKIVVARKVTEREFYGYD